jgi:hypothetical protein
MEPVPAKTSHGTFGEVAVLEATSGEHDAGLAGPRRHGGDGLDQGVVKAGRDAAVRHAVREILEDRPHRGLPVDDGAADR